MDRGRVTFYFFLIFRGKTGIQVDSTFRETSLHTWEYLFIETPLYHLPQIYHKLLQLNCSTVTLRSTVYTKKCRKMMFLRARFFKSTLKFTVSSCHLRSVNKLMGVGHSFLEERTLSLRNFSRRNLAVSKFFYISSNWPR